MKRSSYLKRTELKRSRMRRKAKPNKYNSRPRDHDRKLFVNSLPCCRCGKPPRSEAHHAGERAYGKIAKDDTMIPLCRLCHVNIPKLNEFAGKAERREWLDEQIAQTQSLYLSSQGKL